ncbi:hypothetical protein PRIC2_000760 [Phytophthora ramorum]
MASNDNELITPPGQISALTRISKNKFSCSCGRFLVRGEFEPVLCSANIANHGHMTGWAYLHDYEMELINLLRPLNWQKKCMAYVKHEINEENMRILNEDVDRLRIHPAQLSDAAVIANEYEGKVNPYRERSSIESLYSGSGDSLASEVSEDVADHLDPEWEDL